MHVEHTPARVREGEFEVDTDRSRLSLDVVHGFLSTSYWSPGIAREVVQRAMSGSICFGIYHIPAAEVPEKNVFYRLAKRLFFNDFGQYAGHDARHAQASAPAVLAK